MTKNIDFDKYRTFVDAVTSDESKDFIAFSDRVVSLDEKGANIERLLTGAVGINSEGGETMLQKPPVQFFHQVTFRSMI